MVQGNELYLQKSDDVLIDNNNNNKTHFIAPSIKKNDRKALYKGKIQNRNIQP